MDSDVTFPSFARLPDIHEPFFDAPSYYQEDPPGVLTLKRSWCLVAEIVDNTTVFRPEVWLRTRHGGQPFRLVFYHDTGARSTTGFEFNQLLPGHTLAVLYAERKTFLDGNVGIRHEDLDTVWVFKAPLAVVHEEAAKALAQADIDSTNEVAGGAEQAFCFQCGQTDTPQEPHATCAGCELARYCSRRCQRGHWAPAHRTLCRQDADKLLRLACIGRHPFPASGIGFTMATLPPHRRLPP